MNLRLSADLQGQEATLGVDFGDFAEDARRQSHETHALQLDQPLLVEEVVGSQAQQAVLFADCDVGRSEFGLLVRFFVGGGVPAQSFGSAGFVHFVLCADVFRVPRHEQLVRTDELVHAILLQQQQTALVDDTSLEATRVPVLRHRLQRFFRSTCTVTISRIISSRY